MEAIARSPARTGINALGRFDPANVAAWLVPAALVVYLALENGGYGPIERGQVGLIAWAAVLAGTLIGALPAAGGTRSGRVLFALLALFAGWTALSFGWTESDERTSLELARVAAYLGVFALALSIQGGERWRYLFNGIATGVAIVCGIAVLSRLEPSMFPERITGEYLPGIEIERRLAYPLNYSSGLGALAAMALPLLLTVAGSARTLVGQALGAAVVPVLALTLWLTTSSLSVPVAAIGILGFILLSSDRLPKLATLAVTGTGSAILLAAANQREALDRGLANAALEREGDEMMAIILVVCAGVALLQVGIGLAARYATRPQLDADLSTAGRDRQRRRRPCRAGGGGPRGPAGRDLRPGRRVQGEWDDRPRRLEPVLPAARCLLQRPLPVLGVRRGRQRDGPAQGDRARHVRVLVVAKRHLPRLRPRRPLPLHGDAGRARHRGPCPDRILRPRAAGVRRGTRDPGAPRDAAVPRRGGHGLRLLPRRRRGGLDLGARRDPDRLPWRGRHRDRRRAHAHGFAELPRDLAPAARSPATARTWAEP